MRVRTADALDTAEANAPTEPGPPDPTFAAASADLVGWMRTADGITESFDDLLALPDEEILAKATFLGVAFAAPGQTAATVVDLAPGEYLAVCFVPKGATPEVIAAGPPPEAEPHFARGMRHEFTVA